MVIFAWQTGNVHFHIIIWCVCIYKLKTCKKFIGNVEVKSYAELFGLTQSRVTTYCVVN